MPCSLLWKGFISGRPAGSDLSKFIPGMLVPSTLLPLTVVLALPLMSAFGDQEQTLAGCNNGDQFWANVTRRSDGDAWTSSCPRCDAMCRQAKAARLRCSLREYLCTCQCLDNRTFRNDINLCVDSFSDCRATLSTPSQIQFVDFNQPSLAQDSPHASTVNRGERSARCQVKNTRVLKCGDWRNLDSLNMTEGGLRWNITMGTGNAGFGVWWTGTSEAFQSLSGYVLSLEIPCYHGNKVTTSCAVVKMAGTRGYAVPMEGASTHPPVVIAPETEGSSTTEGAIPKLLGSNNGTTIANYTKELTDEEYKHLEMLVTAICLSVSILLCVLLTCFALEKRIQSKKRGSEKQCASQTRTYTHEVSHCRKTLMDVYDMPMIRFNASMTGSGEDEEASSPPVIQVKKKDKDMVLSEIKADHEADGEESTSPSSSEHRIGSSSEMLASESSTAPGSYLGVQQKNSTDPEFKNWRPCAKQSPPGTGSKSMSSLSPTKKKNPPGILKKSPNTSPTRSPNRSPSMMRWSDAKKATLVKKPPVLQKGWKTVVARHFQQQKQPHQNVEGIEMRPVNGMASPEPQAPKPQAPKRSILKHGSRWKALAPKLAPMVSAEEFAEDTHQDASTTRRGSDNHHVVINCEVHHENERREKNVDSDEKGYTEKSPLTRSIKMVLDSKANPQGKTNCIEWRRKDYDGVPCTDV